MRKVKQSTAKNVMLLMVDSTDHVTGKTGLTLTITSSKDGAAFAAIAPTVTDLGSGWYSVALTAGMTDTLGDLALHATGAAADPADMVLLVEGGNTDVDVSSRLATAGYTAPDNAMIAAIAGYTDSIESRLPAALVGGRIDASVGDMAANVITGAAMDATAGAEIADAVWDEAIAGHLTAGSTGLALNSAGSSGDPWATAIPGAYAAGTAGKIVGDSLDAAVSSRLSTAGYTAPNNAGIAAIDARLPTDPADASDIAAATAAIIADTNDIQTRLPAALVGGRMASIAEVVSDKTNYSLAAADYAALVDLVWDEAVDGAVTPRELLRGFASALMAKLSGADVNAPVFRDLADTKNRITATTDAMGNRTAITLDLT